MTDTRPAMTDRPLHVRDATLPDGTGADLVIAGGVIRSITTRGSADVPAGAIAVDAAGLTVLPGLIDLHTHLREPGFEQSETVATGTRAAAKGGFTTVFAMANTLPVQDTAGVVEQVQALGDAAGYATVRPIGAVTVGLAGERLAEIGAMASSRARVRVFSDDGKCVSDPLLMRRALEYVTTFGGVIAQHAQDPRLTEGGTMNEGELSGELGLGGWPAVAEESIIARDVLLAEHVGARLHVCHLSTAGAVEVVRWAKARGIDVTCEVTPHHLLLTEQLIAGRGDGDGHGAGRGDGDRQGAGRGDGDGHGASYDARYKVNPPLRSDEDVAAVRAGLADGTIDIVATDHAPHPAESKEAEWDAASFGMVGLESALSVVQAAMIDDGPFGWADVERVLSRTPARIGSLETWAGLAEGAVADLCLVDPTASRDFGVADLAGRSANSPFLGRRLPGRVVATIRHGEATVLDGQVVERG